MVFVVLGTMIGLLALAGVWGARRRVAAAAWDRELAAAFALDERREMPMRPVL